MIELSVKSDIAQALKRLAWLEPRQMPFIVSLAMNRTMRIIKEDERTEMAKVFDRPTPFTLNSLQTVAARKDNLETYIKLKDFAGKGMPAAKYLLPEVQGGPRVHKRFEKALIAAGAMPSNLFAVPSNTAPLDGYGNLRGALITQVLSYLKAFPEVGYIANRTAKSKAKRTAQFFVVNPNNRVGSLPFGIYQRKQRTFTMVIAFVKQPTYRKRFPFYEVAQRDTSKHLIVELQKAAEYAISTSNSTISVSDIAAAVGNIAGI